MTDETPLYSRQAYVYFSLHGIPGSLGASTGSTVVNIHYKRPFRDTTLFSRHELDLIKELLLKTDGVKKSGATDIIVINSIWLREDEAE